MKIWQNFKNRLLHPGALFRLTVLSHLNWGKSLFKKDKVFYEKPYDGQKIILLALFEKGVLRGDIENLLTVAKRLGVYTVCVNTLKLDNPEQDNKLIDCYIERYNFGRDFGSYKAGFMHLYKRRWHEICPRLLVLNDSLFYSRNNQANFIETLLQTEVEVLGATENHEIEHHLGSFCLSLDGSIVRKDRLRTYWKKYSSSDVRPVVIKRGEMKLSKTLHRCVASPGNLSAQFDLTWFSEYINSNKDFLDVASDFYRASNLVDWKRPSINKSAMRVINKYMMNDQSLSNLEIKMEAGREDVPMHFVDNARNLQHAIASSLKKDIDLEVIERRVYAEVKYDLLESFSTGSQIHQNGILLHYLGLPIIKLDGLYRGMFSNEDIENLAQQLEPDEVIPFKRLMYSKPFGGEVLYGWKRSAFYRGLI